MLHFISLHLYYSFFSPYVYRLPLKYIAGT